MAPLPRTRRPAEREAQPVRALSGDALLLARLEAGPLVGVVHSVFERVVNVAPEGGGLFTLAARHVDDAPDTLVLDIDGWSAWGIAGGDSVLAGDGAIGIGKCIVIATAAAVPWAPVLPAYPGESGRLHANLEALRAHVRDVRAGATPSPAAGRADALLEAALHRLATAWSAGDPQGAAAAVQSMIGLGPGLTPSGDDVLLGLFAACRLPGHPCAPLAARAAEMLGDLERRTHAISAAGLRAAAAGRVRESIAALLRELVHGTPGTLRAPLARVLAIGSSSGADIVRGLAAGLAMTGADPTRALQGVARCDPACSCSR